MKLGVGRAGRGLLRVALALWVGGCSDGPHQQDALGPDPSGQLAPVVSDPGTLAGGANLSITGSGFVYVSLPAGIVSGQARAELVNSRTGTRLTLPLAEDGLDPVPMPGAAGDTIRIVIHMNEGGTQIRFAQLVPDGLSPIVVRTRPPRKRDLPRLRVVQVVFSEPMNPATINGTTIRLLQNSVPLSGRVVPASDGLSATIELDEPLAPLTEYTLVIAAEVADLDGETLGQPIVVTFTTGTALPPPAPDVASITLGPNVLSVLPRESGILHVALWPELRNAAGRRIFSRSLTWNSSNPQVTVVTGGMSGDPALDTWAASQALVYASGATGSTTLTASVNGRQASLTLIIERQAFSTASVGNAGLKCFLTEEGTAYCSGDGNTGANGTGFGTYAETPQSVTGGYTFASISAGSSHTCALTPAGTAYCWGAGSVSPWDYYDSHLLGVAEDLGDCTRDSWYDYFYDCSLAPVPVAGGLTFSQIAVGYSQTCGLAALGAAYCWGDNWDGENGDGTTAPRRTPTPVVGSHRFVQLTVGRGHTCGLDADGAAWCWGKGPMGNGADGSIVPVPVAGGLRFTQLSSGSAHVCGLTAEGAVYCWGYPMGTPNGESPTSAPVPALVALPSGVVVTQLDSGGLMTCGIAEDGKVYCWGGYPADPAFRIERFAGPTVVLAGIRFKSVSVGAYSACGVALENVVYCWDQRLGTIVGQPYRLEGQR